MAVIKCRRSRGYKPETKQVVALTTYNLAMERALQELLPIFGLLIGAHVFVVAGSHVAVHYRETGETSARGQMCFHLPIWAITLFRIRQKPPQMSVQTFCEIEVFFSPSPFSSVLLQNVHKNRRIGNPAIVLIPLGYNKHIKQ